MYQGEYKNNMKNGKGKLETKEEDYDGDWINDEKNGYGI